jgi:hypothetical protein
MGEETLPLSVLNLVLIGRILLMRIGPWKVVTTSWIEKAIGFGHLK